MHAKVYLKKDTVEETHVYSRMGSVRFSLVLVLVTVASQVTVWVVLCHKGHTEDWCYAIEVALGTEAVSWQQHLWWVPLVVVITVNIVIVVNDSVDHFGIVGDGIGDVYSSSGHWQSSSHQQQHFSLHQTTAVVEAVVITNNMVVGKSAYPYHRSGDTSHGWSNVNGSL